MAEKKMVAIRTVGEVVDIGAEASRAIPKGFRYRYQLNVEYTLEDGQVVPSEIRGKTLSGVTEQLEQRKHSVANRLLSANKLRGDWFFFHKMKAGA